jgi:hypothetical protein
VVDTWISEVCCIPRGLNNVEKSPTKAAVLTSRVAQDEYRKEWYQDLLPRGTVPAVHLCASRWGMFNHQARAFDNPASNVAGTQIQLFGYLQSLLHVEESVVGVLSSDRQDVQRCRTFVHV